MAGGGRSGWAGGSAVFYCEWFLALDAWKSLASRLSGGDAAGGDSYADGIPRQAVNAALATADPVASMCRQRPSWNTPGAYLDVADSRARGYLATDRRAIAASHAAYATATDAGGKAVIAVASCRIAPCRRLASYQSLSV